ncbi:FtsW/RodA/SpoVE family cell cycle protein [Deinococcus yavapaiensis]|uniref:FtsW/RodA/SpoVE family cell cycle protein n=1 Tax=Deinococcus yavapaiensis TaxID=309889 RepID=UPI001FE59FC3|nr:FtsW/RodA/SpoVE family cell cycle protein [Deinococcus yavapaiensis]
MSKLDFSLPMLVALLLCAGLLTISSISSAPALDHQNLFQKQLLGVALSLVPIGLMWWAGRDRIFAFAPFLYFFALLLQASTFVIGKDVNGQTNWIDIGFLQFQPLEILKFATILFLASVMRGGYQGFASYLAPLALFLPGVGLVVTEDFGGALVLSVIFLAILFAWRAPIWHLALALVAVAVVFPTVVYPHLKPYQQARLTIFLDPYKDPRGQGYQVIQSTIAVGSGGFEGKGYKQGTQSHNGFVPEPHNDFVFASFAEEQGFVGSVALLVVFALLLWRLAGMATDAPRLQDQLVFAGVLGQIGFQVIENIGAALSMLPLTGITLPLVSYGLSSLVSVLSTLGMAWVIYRDRFQEI